MRRGAKVAEKICMGTSSTARFAANLLKRNALAFFKILPLQV
jgi:hypothetical protein